MTADIPRPPWPAHWKCTGCDHRRDEHAEPLVRNGVCMVAGCPCDGWDPLTGDQWRTLFAAQREGLL